MISLARTAAAEHLRDLGFLQEAEIVERGDGDDFLEVRIAKSLLTILSAKPVITRPKYNRRMVGEEC